MPPACFDDERCRWSRKWCLGCVVAALCWWRCRCVGCGVAAMSTIAAAVLAFAITVSRWRKRAASRKATLTAFVGRDVTIVSCGVCYTHLLRQVLEVFRCIGVDVIVFYTHPLSQVLEVFRCKGVADVGRRRSSSGAAVEGSRRRWHALTGAH